MSLSSLFALDHTDNLFAAHISHSSCDNGVADLSDEDNELAGCVVVLRVLPDKKNQVHDRDEDLWELCKLVVTFQVHKLVSQSR